MKNMEVRNAVSRMMFVASPNSVPEATGYEFDGWVSLSRVNLIATMDARFGIRSGQKELLTQRNVGDLPADIQRKVGG